MNRLLTLATMLGSGLFASYAAANTISINRMDVHDLRSTYFELEESQKLEVEFLAPRQDEDDNNDFVWIINLDNRELVWRSRRAAVLQDEDHKMNTYGDTIRLNEGRYALYFSTHNFSYDSDAGIDILLYGLSSLWDERHRITRDDIAHMYVDLRGEDIQTLSDPGSFKPFGGMVEVLSFRQARRNEYEQFGLTVKKPTEIAIYAVGEIVGSNQADSARLKNIDNGEIVWQMDSHTTRSAGGAKKNRQFKDKLKLEKGNYVLSYTTDGSHHYRSWNNRPPYDPQAWGVSVFSASKSDIAQFDPEQQLKSQELVSIDKVGNDALAVKHFELSKEAKVRVYALGERYGRKSMADHGWLIDNQSMKKVWQMRAQTTEHAGGASKNRVATEVITLPAGQYSLYYTSDGSHSYGDGWNAASPFDGKKWGITLYAIAESFDKSTVKSTASPHGAALAQIIGIRDSEHRSAAFELDKAQDVRVYALGEGDRDEMHDYAYIKDQQSGKRVWYMFADETEHAGGAHKNRQVNTVIHLPAGQYKVYYRSDGSHSFGDWNDTPPTDQYNYGVSVFPVK